jgi:hypothetical protein
MLVKFLLELIDHTSSLEALANWGRECWFGFDGYSNADLTGLQLSKIVKGKTNIILRPLTQFAAKLWSWCDWLFIKTFEFERFYESDFKVRTWSKSNSKGWWLYIC